MEIKQLKVEISDKDLNDLAGKNLPKDYPVDDLKFEVTAEGIAIKGTYPLFINVSFETRWELAVNEGKLTARLSSVRALGMPGNVFKSAILKVIADAVKDKPSVQLQDDLLLLDVEALLFEKGLIARTNFSALICRAGSITIEAERVIGS